MIIGKLLLLAVMITVIISLFMLADGLIMILTKQNSDLLSGSSFIGNRMQYVQMIAFIGGTLLMYALFERKKGWSMGWSQKGRFRSFSQGLLLGITAISIVSIGIIAASAVRVESVSPGSDVWLDLMSSFLFFVVVAINEEMLVRGYIQGLLRHHYGVKSAIVFSSLLFALLHGMNPGVWDSPIPILNVLLVGVTLGLCREISGGLWLPVGFHLMWNFFQGNVYGFQVSGNNTRSLLSLRDAGPDWLSGGAFGAEGSLFAIVVILACCNFLYRKRSMFGPAKDSRVLLSSYEKEA